MSLNQPYTHAASVAKQARMNAKAVLTAIFISASLIIISNACGGSSNVNDAMSDGDAQTSEVKTGVKPEPDPEVAVIEFENAAAFDKFVIELYPNIAPKTVERFKTLAREGFYDGTAIHRVEPPTTSNGGVIQGGDPNSKDDDPTNDGRGESSYPDLEREPSDLPYERGTVGAADAGPGTVNSQFFISLGPNPNWEGTYTAFGKVIRGMNNVDIVSRAPARPGTVNPESKIVIKSVRLEPRANYQ